MGGGRRSHDDIMLTRQSYRHRGYVSLHQGKESLGCSDVDAVFIELLNRSKHLPHALLKAIGLRMGVACCHENTGHVLLNAIHDVIDSVPFKGVELMGVCPH